MKNKNKKPFSEYRHLKWKITFGILLLLAGSYAVSALVYFFVLRGRANVWAMNILVAVLGGDYIRAENVYLAISRYKGVIMAGAPLAIFAVSLSFFASRITGYFKAVNNGIDALNSPEDEIRLPQDLAEIERTLHSVRAKMIGQTAETKLLEQRKNDLIVYLAHDLKTPLASVTGYISLLLDGEDIPEELRLKYLHIVQEKAGRLEELIDEFFEIARYNLSDIKIHCGNINLTRLLEQLVFEFKPMFAEKNLSCRLSAGEDLRIECDADKIQRVFDNLLRNAVLYSFPDTEITVCAKELENDFEITFQNAGDTIPADKLERIFEQFYRLDSARSAKGGAGLGLAIAKKIAELHGGSITAQSENETTVFTVVLPKNQSDPNEV